MSDARKEYLHNMLDLEKRFAYHPPKNDQLERYTAIRAHILSVAKDIAQRCPDSRERSLAFTHLEEAMFYANASIARNE